MRRLLCGPLAFLTALWAFPTPVLASTLLGPAPEGEEEEEDLVIIEEEMEGEAPAEEEEAGPEQPPGAEGEAGIDDLFDEGGPEATPGAPEGVEEGDRQAEEDSQAKLIKTETKLITVVQRQRMLKKNRIDIQPQVGISVNDPYVRHYSFGAEFRYWLTNRMALGVTGTGMFANLTPRYDNVKIQEGLLLTANKVLWQAGLLFQYNPFYGKIAIFNQLLLHWEGFIQIGGGALQTQVIPRFDALHEPFNVFTGGGQFTIGAQWYVPQVDWMSINIGGRTWVYPDKLEPAQRGPDPDAGDLPELDDPDTAKAEADWQVQFNTILYLGLSFYFPTSFEYTTPR